MSSKKFGDKQMSTLTKSERIAYLIAMGFNFPQTEEEIDKETMNKEAVELAKKITGDESPDLEHFVFKGNDWTFEYRPYYGDWVSWFMGQVLGTIRGNNAKFIKWAKDVIDCPMIERNNRYFNNK